MRSTQQFSVTLPHEMAEAVRDATLATSGKLNLKPFGPPVPVMEDDAGLVITTSSET